MQNIPSHFVDRRWAYVFILALVLLLAGYKVGNAYTRANEITVTVIYGQQPQQFLSCYKRDGNVTLQHPSGPLTEFDVCVETLYK
jgi:hypothetical protein